MRQGEVRRRSEVKLGGWDKQGIEGKRSRSRISRKN